MTTAKYRCSACGEPLIRPVLSCPYCGAFRSAVLLDDLAEAEGAEPSAPDDAWQQPASDEAWEQPAPQGARRIEPGDVPAEPAPEPEQSPADSEWPDLGPVRGQGEPAPEPDRRAADDDDWGLPPPPPLRAQARPREEPARDATLRTVPRPPRAGRPGENRGSRRNEPKVDKPPREAREEKVRPRTRKVGELSRNRAPEPEQVPEPPAAPVDAPEQREVLTPRVAAPPPEVAPEPKEGERRRSRRRASEQRRAHGPERRRPKIEPAPVEPPEPEIEDDDWDETDDYADDRQAPPDYSDEDAGLAAPRRERRRRGRGGWIAFLIVLLVLAGAIGGGAYWVDRMGLMSLLAPNSLRVTRLGEASSVKVPTSWTAVRDPSAGGAVGVLLSSSGPFRVRVDGTVYSLSGASPVRVPVRPGTVLEMRGRDGPVTVDVTRLGEEAADQ